MAEIKLDLHVHTDSSYDALISLDDLDKAFELSIVDQVAITDHNEINNAILAQKRFGEEKIIIGEEISTDKKQHVIGLFLTKFVPSGLTARRTCELIKSQGGLVYIPHPFDPKTGIGPEQVSELNNRGLVDILETHNAWMHFTIFTPRMSAKINANARSLAEELNIVPAAGTDSHTFGSLGNSYNVVTNPVNHRNILKELSHATKKETLNKFDSDIPKALWKSLGKRLQNR